MNRSVDRAMDIIEFASHNNSGVSLREIQDHCELPKSSAFDIVRTLVAHKVLREIPGRNTLYAPGIQLYLMGSRYPESQPIVKTSIARLQEIAELTGNNAYSGIIQGQNLVYTYKYKPKGSILTAAGIGEQKDLHSTALGKILIAFQDERRREQFINELPLKKHTEFSITDRTRFREEILSCRAQGFATDTRETDNYTFCVSAAVLNSDGFAEMAVSLSNIWSMERDTAREVSLVCKLAHELSQSMGYRGAMPGDSNLTALNKIEEVFQGNGSEKVQR